VRIVVCHLTRMLEGRICVAGIDMETRQHVRPVFQRERMDAFMLARNGGPFEMASIVRLPDARPVGRPPEVEDHAFDWMRASLEQPVEGGRFWRMLERVAGGSVEGLFGPTLTREPSGSCWAPEGVGRASLGVLLPPARPQLQLEEIRGRQRVRLSLREGGHSLRLSVTDIRFFEADLATPSRAAVESVAARLCAGVEVILGLGLTRPYARSDQEAPRHWLQVTAIHLRDDPAWRLG